MIQLFHHQRRRYPTSPTLEAAFSSFSRALGAVRGTDAEPYLHLLAKRLRFKIAMPLERIRITEVRETLRAGVNFFRDMEDHDGSRQIIKRMWHDVDRRIKRLVENAASVS